MRLAFHLFLLLMLLSGCANAAQPHTVTPAPLLPTQSPADPQPSRTPAPTGTAAPAPTTTASPQPSTTPPVGLAATVWTKDPLAPALVYHRFLPYGAKNESFTKIALATYRDELQMLYDAGFSLVPLAAWLKGDLRVPPGRRPLIYTMDDLFFADQIFLNPDGTPSDRSGLGILWQFSQAHSDFGFSAAIFYNLGDKLYANKPVGNWFNVSPGWEGDLARAIAWCIEHGAMPYNHFYTHPYLLNMEPRDVTAELSRNEVQLQKLLASIDKGDLSTHLDNLIALPYSIWPDSRGSRQVIINYQSLNGHPVLGIMESNPHMAPAYLIKPPYADGFNPYHIQRIGSTMRVIQDLIRNIDLIPAAQECSLPVDPARAQVDAPYLATAIRDAISAGRCPPGVYVVAGQLFRASSASVETLALKLPDLPVH